ncbi:MAG: hypothetical protein M1812_002796 [Candelaria pacifica]|nr:MAG: hypothetical protein M1812_002796 [Candelaria pacifica]
MADTKRQSGKNAVATPNVGGAATVPLETALSAVIGARVRIAVGGKIVHEGTIFAVCPITNLLAINTAPPPPTPASNFAASQPGDYRILPISDIRSFDILSLPLTGATFEDALPNIGTVDMKAVKAREEAAIRKLQEKELRRGKGVGKEGQDIFNALERTLPTRWHETSIVVLDSVMIAPPYRVEDCKTPQNQQAALTRVKKVLEMERKKIADRSNRPAVPLPQGPRKGG